MKYAYRVSPIQSGTSLFSSIAFGDQTAMQRVERWPISDLPFTVLFDGPDSLIVDSLPFEVISKIYAGLNSLNYEQQPDGDLVYHHIEVHSSNDSYILTFDDGKNE